MRRTSWMLQIGMKFFFTSFFKACECVYYESRSRSQGVFNSPNFGLKFGWTRSESWPDCFIYSFLGQRDEIVELQFTHLKLATSRDCVEFLRFFLDLEEAEIGPDTPWNYQICGGDETGMSGDKYFSSFRNLLLEYRPAVSNNSGFKGRFKFYPKSKFEMNGGTRRSSQTCAFDFYSSPTNSAGRFYSPKFPQNYPPSSNCIYVFHGLEGELVRLEFEKIRLEKSMFSCLEAPDFIVIREDIDPSGQVIGHLCHEDDAQMFVSSGRQAYVDFMVDFSNQSQGFQARYEFVGRDRLQPILPRLDFVTMSSTASDHCTHNYTSLESKSGIFTSPNYPHPPTSNAGHVCRYLFQGLGRERVKISIINLDLLASGHVTNKDCDHEDSITVTTFIKGYPVDLGIFCGKVKPPTLMSSDGRMEVTYFIHQGSLSSGFKARFKFVTDFGLKYGIQADDVVCGFTFNSDLRRNGSFISPNHPGLYPRGTECHYFFFADKGEIVQIHFIYLDIDGAPPKCLEDYLEFSNFNIPIADRKMSRYCGRYRSLNRPPDVTSDGNFFRATFRSDENHDGFGFEANYRFIRVFDLRQQSPDELQLSNLGYLEKPSFWLLCPIMFTSGILVLNGV